MRTIKHLVIAAAGTGSRLGMGVPKCLIDFHGRPLIHHLLDNVQDIEDVRIVVGFKPTEVINAVRSYRSDVTFIINNDYKSTTTLHSYLLGSEHLTDGVCYLDADIFFIPSSFSSFLKRAEANLALPLIGITKAKTEDCVYASLTRDFTISSFSRSVPEPWEWANIAYLPPGFLSSSQHCAVYQALEPLLPLPAALVDSYEIDTPKDLEAALHVFLTAKEIQTSTHRDRLPSGLNIAE